MHIKFLAHGTGDPYKAVNYLLADKDHNGMLRPEVTVLRGDPRAVADVAASSVNVHRFTSGVIAWAPEDQPSQEEMEAVIGEFERLAFAGLEPEEVSYSIVCHGDHLHIIVARVNLKTGKSINIAPPIWRKHFDHLRDHWNHKLGWGHPGDPSRSRLVYVNGHERKVRLSALRQAEALSAEMGFAVSDILHASGVEPSLKEIISDRLELLVLEGVVKKRADVLQILEEYGEINRKGRDSLSIRPHGEAKPIRFEGPMFVEDFSAEHFLSVRRAPGNFERAQPDLKAAEQARQDMEEAILRRERYYASRRLVRRRARAEVVGGDASVVEQSYFAAHQSQERVRQHDRDRNTLIEEFQRCYESAQSAVRGFVRACIETVSGFGAAERANRAAQRASIDAQQASLGVERAVDALGTRAAAVRAQPPEVETRHRL
jgi:hypothetical protein